MTAEELRSRILSVVTQNGGHLASSLGAVELAMALAKVFTPEKDRIVWDVGHQSYAWKILTGRDAAFETLRTYGGLSGFPNPSESSADAAIAGHAGVALSVAEGLAAARDRLGTDEHVIAVVGDGAIANGTSLEALNNCATATKKVIVILNDNEMSISRPTGSLARLFGRLITGVRYNRVKAAAEKAGHRLHLTFLRGPYHAVESRIKSLFVGNILYERLGLRYTGPVDGHDLAALTAALTVAREDEHSVLVHVVTKKGRGYRPAELDPTTYHGVSPAAKPRAAGAADTRLGWSETFGNALTELAMVDSRIVALTAAMCEGTGLKAFRRAYAERFYDVGIAEGHLVAFAAGLAAGGLRPVVAVYSTFLQRAIDQVMHDVCISKQPVVFCIDRAGLVGADGVTHQGLYDYAMLKSLPNLTILQPVDAADLRQMLSESLLRDGPTVIRYPRGKAPESLGVVQPTRPPRYSLWVTADWTEKANQIASELGDVEVVPVRSLKPIDTVRLSATRAQGLKIVSLENLALAGGLGETIGADIRFGWPDTFIEHGNCAELEVAYGLDAASIVRRLA